MTLLPSAAEIHEAEQIMAGYDKIDTILAEANTPSAHPAFEAAAAPPVTVLRDTVDLTLFWGCGHQVQIRAHSVTTVYGDRIISFPSLVTSPDTCWSCRVRQALAMI